MALTEKRKQLNSLVRSTTGRLVEQRLDTADATDGLIPPRTAGEPQRSSGKAKMVRETFCLTEDEQALIPELSVRAAREGKVALKSHIVRAALKYLALSTTEDLTRALGLVERVKPGRK
jgi:hypothetical protein